MSGSVARRFSVLCLALTLAAAACVGGDEGAERSPNSYIVTESTDSESRVRATLAHECARAGGEQALTVQTDGDVGIQYVSTYADGKAGGEASNGDGYGGNGLGLSSDGLLDESWTVSAQAPPGIVVVYVNALLPGFDSPDPDQALTRLRLSYLLVGPEAQCPEGEPEIPRPEVMTDTEDSHPVVRATVSHECVQAGERQTLTVRGGRGMVTYNTIYANGENGRPRPNGGGYGGAGFGAVGLDGEAELAWAIEEDAPPGVATVLVKMSLPENQGSGGSEDSGVPLTLTFRIVGSGEECP